MNLSQGEKTQKKRARKAVSILNAAYDRGQHRENIVDMLSDLRHLSDVKGIDFYAALETSYNHYLAEWRGEDAEPEGEQYEPYCGVEGCGGEEGEPR